MVARLSRTVVVLMGVCMSLMAAALADEVSPAGWPAYELPLGGHYIHASLQPYPSGAGSFPSGGRQSVHVAHVMPGRAYRLGLRLRSSVAKKLTVSLYDRWPYAEGARPVQLSTAGGLRGRQGDQEYQWWFSIHRESPGTLLYIKVAVEPGFSGSNGDWGYQIFIVDSPRSPMNSMGRGVVYHRGPSNLKLREKSPSVALRYVAVPAAKPVRHVSGDWRPGQPARFPGLIKNGDFESGLRYWQLQPEGAPGVGVLDGRLHLWSRDSAESSGVLQQVNANVAGAGPLRLEMDLMIRSQAEPSGAGRAPLMLSVCYEDAERRFHCGNKAFRKYFTIRPADGKSDSKREVVLPAGVWSRYSVRLNELAPGLRKIISIGLSGAGAPEREAWVERIMIRTEMP